MVISNQTQYFDLLCKLDFCIRFLPKNGFRNFPGSPVANTLCFQHRGSEFNPWSGN